MITRDYEDCSGLLQLHGSSKDYKGLDKIAYRITLDYQGYTRLHEVAQGLHKITLDYMEESPYYNTILQRERFCKFCVKLGDRGIWGKFKIILITV